VRARGERECRGEMEREDEGGAKKFHAVVRLF